jgi:glycosyltransferase involved in cell wall biosynthesis
MTIPAVSVVMPVYNVEEYVAEAIESILNQTFKDFEFIIIDDASTDDTVSVIKTFSDERIKLVCNETNLKLAASLNRGLRIARGKYIARMDGDDISHLARIEKLYKVLEQNPAIAICGTRMKLFGSQEGVWGNKTDDKEIKAGLIWGSTMQHGTVLMRMDTIIKHNLFYDETFHLGQDWKYWYDVKNFVVFSNSTEVLYYYRRGRQNITVQFSHQSKERYSVMHRIMLRDMGISFTERELQLHQFPIGLFSLSPSPQIVKEARAWLKKLTEYNRVAKQYDVAAFERIAEEHWFHLFYLIAPYGLKTILAYFRVTGVAWLQISYYLKFRINKLIGRKTPEK